MRFFAYLFIITFMFSNCLAEEANDETVFKEKLVQWVDAANVVAEEENTENVKKLDDAFIDLRRFSREHPDSQYADDAEFIRYKGTEVPPEQWEKFAAKYYDGKIEDFTKEQLRRLKGNFSAFAYECYIPYGLLPLYVKGQNAWLGLDYKEAERYLSEFLQKLDFYSSDLKRALQEPYFNLLTIYKSLNKRKEYDKIKEKARKLFPEKADFLERHWPL